VSKAFVRESEPEEADVADTAPSLPSGKNYMSPAGYARLKAELKGLVEVERPKVVQTVSWAASNGDRSENGDYIYGKKRLREIDRRVRFLIKRLEGADVVDSAGRESDQVFFGRDGERRVRARRRALVHDRRHRGSGSGARASLLDFHRLRKRCSRPGWAMS
jgi:hypothetical protein